MANEQKELVQLTDSNFYIMLALLENRHGYGIMKFIEELTEGNFILGPATLYTIIKKLQNENFIKLISQDNPRKKVYGLTDDGKQIILQEIDRRKQMVKQAEEVLNSIK